MLGTVAGMNGLAVMVAIAAAALFALSTSLQHHSATGTPAHVRRGHQLIWHLVRHPRWLAGQATSVLAFGLHATALKLGTLTVVQPVLVSGLVFTLPVRALMDRRRPTRAELLGAVVTACGLGLFLVVARPNGGQGTPNRLMAAVLHAVPSRPRLTAATRNWPQPDTQLPRRHRAAGPTRGVAHHRAGRPVPALTRAPLRLITARPA